MKILLSIQENKIKVLSEEPSNKIENIKIPVFSFVNKQSLPSELQNDMSNYWILAKKYYSLFSV